MKSGSTTDYQPMVDYPSSSSGSMLSHSLLHQSLSASAPYSEMTDSLSQGGAEETGCFSRCMRQRRCLALQSWLRRITLRFPDGRSERDFQRFYTALHWRQVMIALSCLLVCAPIVVIASDLSDGAMRVWDTANKIAFIGLPCLFAVVVAIYWLGPRNKYLAHLNMVASVVLSGLTVSYNHFRDSFGKSDPSWDTSGSSLNAFDQEACAVTVATEMVLSVFFVTCLALRVQFMHSLLVLVCDLTIGVAMMPVRRGGMVFLRVALINVVTLGFMLWAVRELEVHSRADYLRQIAHEKRHRSADREIDALTSAWQIRFDDVTLDHRADEGSEGGSGAVYHARWRGFTVAVKVFHFYPSSDDDFKTECDSLMKLRHENIVLFFGAGYIPPDWERADWELEPRPALDSMGGRMSDLDSISESGLASDSDLARDVAEGQFEQQYARAAQARPFLVTEFMENGALSSMLASSIELDWGKRIRFAIDAACGMAFLHSRSPPRIHRDLKSMNLLVSSDWVTKIADFGTARLCKIQSRRKHKRRRRGRKHNMGRREREGGRGNGTAVQMQMPRSGDESVAPLATAPAAETSDIVRYTTSGYCGSIPWTAPEIFTAEEAARKPQQSQTAANSAPHSTEAGRGESAAMDVYSYGVVLYEIATRSLPFSERVAGEGATAEADAASALHLPLLDDIPQAVVAGKRPKIPPGSCPPAIASLIEECWCGKPSSRPSFAQIVRRLRHIQTQISCTPPVFPPGVGSERLPELKSHPV